MSGQIMLQVYTKVLPQEVVKHDTLHQIYSCYICTVNYMVGRQGWGCLLSTIARNALLFPLHAIDVDYDKARLIGGDGLKTPKKIHTLIFDCNFSQEL